MAGVRRGVRGLNIDRPQTARKCDLALRRQRLFPKDEKQMMDKSEDRIIDRMRQAQTDHLVARRVTHGLNVSSVEITYP